jgi:hypothetical protein
MTFIRFSVLSWLNTLPLDAKNALELGSKVYLATSNMALQIPEAIVLAASLLWDLKAGKLKL